MGARGGGGPARGGLWWGGGAAGSNSLAFGNFEEGYTIVDRIGMQILRDPYTGAPFIKFRCTKRTGGDVVNFEAIKLLTFAAS